MSKNDKRPAELINKLEQWVNKAPQGACLGGFVSTVADAVVLLRDAYLEESGPRTYIVTEQCPHCEEEIEMYWNTDVRGFKAFCPVCGNRLMLCDECLHMGRYTCDYDTTTDSCRHNEPGPELSEFLDIYGYIQRCRKDGKAGSVRFAVLLREKWTMFCVGSRVRRDSPYYDCLCVALWCLVESCPMPEGCYNDFGSFKLFMGEYMSKPKSEWRM